MFEKLLKAVRDAYDADILLYVGSIDRPFDDHFIARCKAYKKRPNVLLVLTTLGGDPNAAYRIARCLQEEYGINRGNGDQPDVEPKDAGKFYLFVDSRCKSAGTILATGATHLIMSDFAELGPIDVQLRKGDEVGERSSSLTPMHAIESIRDLSIKYFEDCFKELRFNQDLLFGTKGASEIATRMATSLFGEIFSQIDPMRVAEFDRAMRIASEYGSRLGANHLKPGGLARLVAAYPTHGFVIDRKEATEIFKSVEKPSKDLVTLGEFVREHWEPKHLTTPEPLLLALTIPKLDHEDDEEAPVVDGAQPAAGAVES
ncbi:P-loop NTPase family protein [Terriglobus aquaticus]|uniref:SppA protein n=1 Tax=Terriglobus aquaticus TaxID=940139 RepID=A0ABW9KGP3_9BACT|nr:hypothetical protein [Terriglobus aquaticus]